MDPIGIITQKIERLEDVTDHESAVIALSLKAGEGIYRAKYKTAPPWRVHQPSNWKMYQNYGRAALEAILRN